MHPLPVPSPRRSPHVREKPRNLAVLIVDDESLIRWSLRAAFEERGHAVTTAGTGTEALAALAAASRAFDVVLLDYRLPDRHDLSLLGEIKQRSPQSAVFMMTAFADENMRSRVIGDGAQRVIDKPFQIAAVVALVESVAAS